MCVCSIWDDVDLAPDVICRNLGKGNVIEIGHPFAKGGGLMVRARSLLWSVKCAGLAGAATAESLSQLQVRALWLARDKGLEPLEPGV